MVIHFICHGNAFRSIVAEAYLRSFNIQGLEVISSGSMADEHHKINETSYLRTISLLKEHGLDKYAKTHAADQLNQKLLDNSDIAVFMEKDVYDENKDKYRLPPRVLVWDIVDIGEAGRVPTTDSERKIFTEDAYEEIVSKVNELVRLHDDLLARVS